MNNNNINLIYIYEISIDNSNLLIDYNLDLILSFENHDYWNNYYHKLIKGENILKDYNILERKYHFKSYLINKNHKIELTKSSSIIENKENILNNSSKIAFHLYVEY